MPELKPTRIIIAILCLLAISLNVWLSWQKLTGQIDTLAGCGKGSGCQNALGSRWSMVFGVIPVSIPAALTYLSLLGILWLNQGWARTLRLTIAWCLLGSAIWFTGLQFFVIKGFCKYCVASHLISVFTSLLVLWQDARPLHRRSKTVFLSAVPAAFGIVTLIVVQKFGPGPETHRIDTFVESGTNAPQHTDIHTLGEGRLESFLGGLKSYRLHSLPHIGDPEAPHVFVKYFDYTCASCRDVHGDLEKALNRHPGQFVVILLPTPLNRNCNEHLPRDVADHAHACVLGGYALAVWKTDPEKFQTYHNWLFQKPSPTPSAAKAKAQEIIGADALSMALATNWHRKIIQQNTADYRLLVRQTRVMPKLLLGGNRLMQGVAKDYPTFLSVLESQLKLR